MGKTAVSASIGAELDYLARYLNRLDEGFQLEKEEALKSGLKEMTEFRDRCRSHYQLRVGQVRTRLRQLRHTARRADVLEAEMEDTLRVLGIRCREALARYSGTPNRLIRVMKSTREEQT